LRLACAEPGDQLANFGEAPRELSERATFLYEEAGRYWFSTQQTLNRVAEDLAKGLPAHEVDAAIVEVLREEAKGRFHRVFAVPDDPTAVDDGGGPNPPIVPDPISNQQPRRFFGSVEIDMVRPVKAFDAILNAVVMELPRSKRCQGEADPGDRGRRGRQILRGRHRRRPRQCTPIEV
jgi:hypothetical protein